VPQPAHNAVGLALGEDVEIAGDVRFGSHVTVHPRTVLGDGCVLEDGAVVGKAPRLAPHSSASREPLPPLVLDEGVTVGCGAVVFAGARLGPGVIVGDQAYVRERSVIGAGTVVGRGSAVDNDVRVGARVRIQTGVYVTAYSVVEDDVFLGPAAVTTNDHTMARHAPGEGVEGATLRRACRVGAGAVILPGVEVGEEAFVAAGAVVTARVAPRQVVMGVPARAVREVGDEDLLERWR